MNINKNWYNEISRSYLTNYSKKDNPSFKDWNRVSSGSSSVAPISIQPKEREVNAAGSSSESSNVDINSKRIITNSNTQLINRDLCTNKPIENVLMFGDTLGEILKFISSKELYPMRCVSKLFHFIINASNHVFLYCLVSNLSNLSNNVPTYSSWKKNKENDQLLNLPYFPNIKIKLNKNEDINDLIYFIDNTSNDQISNYLSSITFSEKINQNFTDIENLLHCLTQSSKKLSKLTSLSFGHIYSDSTLELPQELPAGLTSLSFGYIGKDAILDLSKLPAGLTSLSFGNIGEGAILDLSKLPAGLTSLSFGYIGEGAILDLSKLPARLTSLSFDGISTGATLKLPQKLPVGLTFLSFGNINRGTTLKLPQELPAGLTSLSFGNIGEGATLELSKLPAGLTSLSFGNIYRDSTLELPQELPAGLTSLSFGYIGEGAILDLSKLPAGLTSLSFRFIHKNATLKLPEELPAGLRIRYL